MRTMIISSRFLHLDFMRQSVAVESVDNSPHTLHIGDGHHSASYVCVWKIYIGSLRCNVCSESGASPSRNKEASFFASYAKMQPVRVLFLASVASATLLCAHDTRARTNAIRKPQPLSIERLAAGRTSIAWRRRLLCGAPLCSLGCL